MNVIQFKKSKRPHWEKVLDSKGRPIPDLIRNIDSGVIYGRKQFRRLGIPALFKSTGEITLGKAKSAWDMLKQSHINKFLGVDDSSVIVRKRERTFGDCAKEVLKEYTPTQRLGTQENHKYYIGELVKLFGEYDPNAISVKLFNEAIKRLKRKGKRKTFMDYAKHMNLVMHYAYNQKYCTHDISFSNPDAKGEGAGRVYTDEEIKSLWKAMGDDQRDLFVLSYECIMRLREAMFLTWSRIDLDSGLITLRASDVKTGSKTGKGRQFQASKNALDRMRARFKRIGLVSPFVFPSPTNKQKPMRQNKTAWASAKKNANIKGRARWHDLRHTALTKALLVHKLNPIEVSEYAGVSVRTIQEIYLHSKAEQTRSVAGVIKILV